MKQKETCPVAPDETDADEAGSDDTGPDWTGADETGACDTGSFKAGSVEPIEVGSTYPHEPGDTTMRGEGVSQLEQYVLLCLIRLGDDAYGVPIHEEIERRTARSVSIATVYSALDRLEKEGLITAHLSAPLPERGGRAKRLFRLSAEGAAALQRARRVHDRMWEGVNLNAVLEY